MRRMRGKRPTTFWFKNFSKRMRARNKTPTMQTQPYISFRLTSVACFMDSP